MNLLPSVLRSTSYKVLVLLLDYLLAQELTTVRENVIDRFRISGDRFRARAFRPAGCCACGRSISRVVVRATLTICAAQSAARVRFSVTAPTHVYVQQTRRRCARATAVSAPPPHRACDALTSRYDQRARGAPFPMFLFFFSLSPLGNGWLCAALFLDGEK